MEQPSLLILKYLKNELSADEKNELDEWLQASGHHQSVLDELMSEEALSEDLVLLDRLYKYDGRSELNRRMAVNRSGSFYFNLKNFYRRYSAAAAILLLLGLGGFFIHLILKEDPVDLKIVTKDDIVKPGRNVAILTLADGSTIVLDSMAKGILGRQGSAQIVNLAGGQLSYSNGDYSESSGHDSVLYNTITTPQGGQYQLLLPDGSKVWLNAASSLTFPVSFTEAERKVKLSGEGYFEIVHNTQLPFKLIAADAEIEVLGTSFNVMAYRDEDFIRSTVVEGAVRVSKQNSGVILRRGQQALVPFSKPSDISVLSDCNLDEVLAWKNGMFSFSNAGIETIMRQVSRWYNVDIVYKDKIPYPFYGKISRNVPLSQLLRLLELTGMVHFEVKGNKVIVAN